LLQPGKYIVFADSAGSDAVGASTLTYESQPASGRGTPEDTCAGALPLSPGETIADTFDAMANVTNRCVPTAAPDVFYRFSLTTRSHATIQTMRSEAPHQLALYKSCGASPHVLECGAAIDATLAPGTYYLGVHGADPASFGEVTLQTTFEDVTAREAACKVAPAIRVGETVRGNTKAGAPLFATRCFGGTSPDRVHKLTLAKPTSVGITVDGTGFRGLVSVRSSCVESRGVGEINCAQARSGRTSAKVVVALPAGTSYIVVSGAQTGQEGPYTLRVEAEGRPAPEADP